MTKQHDGLLKPTPLLRKLQILRILSQSPSSSQNQLARQLRFAVSAVNRLVKELQTGGFLVRQPDGWILTDRGRRLTIELTEAYNAQLNELRAMAPLQAADDSRQPVAIGVLRSLGTAVPLVAKKIGLFDAAGVVVEECLYDYAADILEDLLEGRIVFGCGGMTAFLRARGQDTRPEILAACHSGGHALVVKGDLGIFDLEDLKGRTLLVPPDGTVAHRLFLDYLQTRHPSIVPTLQLEQSISPTNMPLAFMSNDRYTGMVAWEPWVSLAETLVSGSRVLVDFVQAWRSAIGRPYSTSVLVAQPGMTARNPELTRIVREVHENAIRFINEHADRANGVLAEALNVSPIVVQRGRGRVTFHSELHW
jgi:ABC-type nitrate/sulfonate/bicarbonate transport system substrate-binding protein